MIAARRLLARIHRYSGAGALRLVCVFMRRTPREQALVIEAAFLLLAVRLSLGMFAFRTIAGRLGRFVSPDLPQVHRAASGPDAAELGPLIVRVVPAVARHLPFRATCLPQAIAGRVMLQRRGIASTLSFGVLCTGDSARRTLAAHAWLETAASGSIGTATAHQFKEIARLI